MSPLSWEALLIRRTAGSALMPSLNGKAEGQREALTHCSEWEKRWGRTLCEPGEL